MNDLKFAFRQLLKNPGFTTVVVVTLTLGIGANTALFSVVNGVLLNPLPYPQPEQLVSLHQSKPNFDRGAIPYPNFRDWEKENQTFAAMAISRTSSFALIGTGEAERVRGRRVSANMFSVLGVKPALGRDFAPADDERGAGPVVIISAELWQRRFNGAADVLGKGLILDDRSHTVVGVLPASFTLYRGSDVFVPIGQWNAPGLQNRSSALGLHGVGRLKPGVTVAQAQTDLDRVMRRLTQAYPEDNRGNGAVVLPLKESLVNQARPVLWMLLGAVAFVLLIACVNVGNLLLARASSRTREFAVRAALGAGQWRLVRQWLTECILLALIGGGLGLLLATMGTRAALNILPAGLPRADEIALDGRVLLFTAIISLLTGIVTGLAPALKISEWRLAGMLKEGARGTSGGHRGQRALIAVEMALALVLLIGAGLMVRTLGALLNVDPGFQPDNVVTFGLSFPSSMRAASREARRANLRDLNDRLNSMPGVKAASFASGASPMQAEDDLFFWLDGRPKPASTSEMEMAVVYYVDPRYLTAMGIPLKQGRFFTHEDDARTQPIAVIDEVLARKYFPNADPVGRRIHVGDPRGPLEIIGIVGHVKQWGLDEDDNDSIQAQLYLPLGSSSDVKVVVRAEGMMPTLLASIRDVVQNQNSQNIIYNPQTMHEVITRSVSRQRFSMTLLNAFAAAALLLASVGLYGMTSYLVGQRTHELGIRLALGAQRIDVLRLILRQGMGVTLVGMAIGLGAAFALTRVLRSQLYAVEPTDALTFGFVSSLLIVVAFLACLIPARRAAKVDPMEALRYE